MEVFGAVPYLVTRHVVRKLFGDRTFGHIVSAIFWWQHNFSHIDDTCENITSAHCIIPIDMGKYQKLIHHLVCFHKLESKRKFYTINSPFGDDPTKAEDTNRVENVITLKKSKSQNPFASYRYKHLRCSN